MGTATFTVALIALVLVLILWLAVLLLRFYFLRHVKKLKKCLIALKENLEAQIREINPERMANLEKRIEELEGRFRQVEEKRKADLLRYENLVQGLEKRLTEATRIANRISAFAARIGRALAGGEKGPSQVPTSGEEAEPGPATEPPFADST